VSVEVVHTHTFCRKGREDDDEEISSGVKKTSEGAAEHRECLKIKSAREEWVVVI